MRLAGTYPPATRGRAVVWGFLAMSPFGGIFWQAAHYLVGLRRLGFDTWYVEESERPLYDPVTYYPTMEHEANVERLGSMMASLGLADRWVFRPPGGGECIGALDGQGLARLYGEADLALNICGAQELRDGYDAIGCLAYVETDPVKNQVEVAQGKPECIEELDAYDFLFTYGENLGADDCKVPMERYRWLKTRPPVCLDWWETTQPPERDAALTTVANWKHAVKDVVWQGETWRWSKHVEFERFMELPRKAALPLEIALGAASAEDRERFLERGWGIVPSAGLDDPQAYRGYIRGSLGEFTVAKEQYVLPRTGWFSDRSVCYLAAGRPVITQDTAFPKFIPTGEGLLAYRDEDGALAAIRAVAADYERHSRAAREIAAECFDAKRVLEAMLEAIGI